MKLGLKPVRPDAVRFKMTRYALLDRLPPAPATFGRYAQVQQWGMLGNDRYGDCVIAGAAHETMLWNAEQDKIAPFTDDSVLKMYSAIAGFDPNDPSSDQGTDYEEAAQYRRLTGLTDAAGKVHVVDAYLDITRNPYDLFEAIWLFGAAGICLNFPDYAMDQFNRGVPWDVVPGQPEPTGGHYVPGVGRNSGGNIVAVTWGQTQIITPAFLEKYMQAGIAYVSLERLDAKGFSLDGFDREALEADLDELNS
jgi:hypothetical protein